MQSTNGPHIAMPLERVLVIGYLNLGTPQNVLNLNGIKTQLWDILGEYPFSVNMFKSFMLLMLD